MFSHKFNMNALTNKIYGFFVKLGIFGIITFLFITNIVSFSSVDKAIYDRLFYNIYTDYVNDEVVVIIIDDETFDYFGLNSIPRASYAKLLNNELKDSSVVTFDILFPNASTEKDDQEFAEAIEKHGKVVLAYMEAAENSGYVLPYDLFLQATQSLGYVNYEPDDDGYVRKYLLTKETGLGTALSLVHSTLTTAGYRIEINDETNTVDVFLQSDGSKVSQINVDDKGGVFRIPLSSSDNHYKVYEFTDVYKGEIDKSAFDDKIVFLGGSYSGSADKVSTPVEEVLGVKFIVDSLIGVTEGFNPKQINNLTALIYVACIYILVDFFTSLVPGKYKWFVPTIFIVFTFSFGITIATFTSLIITIAYPVVSIIFAFILNLLFSYLLKEQQTEMHKLPVNAILQLNNIATSDNYTFSSYIRILEESILKPMNLSVEHVEIRRTHSLYREYLSELEHNDEIITVQNFVFIPLSNRIDKISHQIDEDDEKHSGSVNREGVSYCVLKSKGKVDKENILHISALILSADIYFKFARESKSKQNLFNSIIESMVAAIDAKDPITSGHSKRVAEVAYKIGKRMDFSEDELYKLRFAAIIHDIGKIGIADDVLNKPSFFSDDDFKEIRKHPEKGVQIMQGIRLDDYLSDGILYHHERIDGKGYPKGLSGDEIPEVARIIKIADVYDALVSERQYKKPWSIEKVCNLFYNGRGTEFDSNIVDIFIEDIKPKGWEPPETEFNYQKVFRYDTKKLALRFLEVYDDNIKEKVDEHPIDIKFEFDLSKDFAGLSFGNHFTDKNWLYTNPICAKVYKETEEMFYFKDDSNTKRRFTYIFLRGYLSSGIVSSPSSEEEKEKYIEDLHRKLGKPFHTEENIEVWDNNRFYILNFKFLEKNKEHCTVYINKYIL